MLGRIIRSIRGFSSRPASRLASFFVIALLNTLPALENAGAFNEFRDAHVLTGYEMAAEKSVWEYMELPLWNPYYCGGMYALGTPQSRFASPTFFISLIFGAVAGQAFIAFLMSVLGMEGFFQYAKTRTSSALGPFLGAPIFALNGFMASSFFRGWINFYGFLLLPWVLFGIGQAARGRYRGVFVVSAAFAVIVGFGGTYSGPIAGLFAVIEGARLIIEKRRRIAFRRLAFFVFLSGISALLFSAFRLYPVFDTLYSAPRIMAGAPGHSFPVLMSMLFKTAAPKGGEVGVFGAMYLGILPLLLALPGIFSRKGAIAAALIALSLWTATGYEYGFSPFVALRELPLFSTLRYPERFLFVACFFAAELTAFGVDRLLIFGRRLNPAKALIPIAAAIALVSLYLQIQNAHTLFGSMRSAAQPAEKHQAFRQARGNRWALGYFPSISRGSLSCWEAYPDNMSPLLKGDLPQEEYLLEPDKGRVTRKRWSPNRIELAATASEPTRLIVNQNWHQGWRTSIGEVVNHQGLLAVDIPAGNHTVTLRFRPKSALVGTAISLLSLIALLGVWRLTLRGKLRPRWQQAVGVLAPPLIGGVVLLLAVEEPAPAKPLLRNADGSPALVDAVPGEAEETNVVFSAPVTLVGFELPTETDDLGIADFALYFLVNGTVPRSIGVFVHVTGPGGFSKSVDHEVVASSLFFDDVPRDRVVRDAFSILLPKGRRGTYEAHVGLWHASGDRTRVEIVNDASMTVNDNRVLLGTFELTSP